MVRQQRCGSHLQREHQQQGRTRSHGYHLFVARTSKYLLFSHTQSSNSVSGISSQWKATVHGRVYAFASVMVICTSICPKLARRNRSVTCSASLCGCPASSSHVFSLMPAVSTTSVSPSHRPTE